MSAGSSEGAAIARAVERHAVLSGWIRPEWHDPRPLAEQARVRPWVRWVVADDFFEEHRLDALVAHHSQLEYAEDDVGLNYHSTAARVDGRPEVTGAELLLEPLWHRYAAFVMGAVLVQPGRTVIKYRRHPPDARGFWLHTDRDHGQPKALAVLGYLNRGWRAEDGGALQLWATEPAGPEDPQPLRWADFEGRRLEFLRREVALVIEAADVVGVLPVRARLLDQVLPRYNRLVFLDFQSGPGFHSVTPSEGRTRAGFLQWLY